MAGVGQTKSLSRRILIDVLGTGRRIRNRSSRMRVIPKEQLFCRFCEIADGFVSIQVKLYRFCERSSADGQRFRGGWAKLRIARNVGWSSGPVERQCRK